MMNTSFQVTFIVPTAPAAAAEQPVAAVSSSKLTFWFRGRSTQSSSSTSSQQPTVSEKFGILVFTETSLDLTYYVEKETIEKKLSIDLATITVLDLLAQARLRKEARLREAIEVEGPDGKYIVLFSTRAEKELFFSILTTSLRNNTVDQLDPYWLHRRIHGTLFSLVSNASSVDEVAELRELCAYAISGRGRIDSDDRDPLITNSVDYDDTPPRFDINAVDEDSGKTVLHVAASLQSSAKARLYSQILLEHGASSSSTDHDFQTPLHTAVVSLNKDVMTLLLANGAQVDAKDLLEQTPLMLLLQSINTEMNEETATLAESVSAILLSYGALVNEADGEGLFPLHRVARTNRPQLVSFLQKRGADPLLRVNGNKETLTALHIACGAEVDKGSEKNSLSSSMIRALINVGCPVNVKTSLLGSTPLHLVLEQLKISKLASNLKQVHESESAASYLCSHGARLDIQDNQGVDCFSISQELNFVNDLEIACKSYAESIPPMSAHAESPPYLESSDCFDFGGDFKVKGKERPLMNVKLQDDASRSTCNGCESSFNQLSRRKHHCRRCGLLMCGACTTKKLKRSATSGDSDDDETTVVNGAFSLMKNLFSPPPPTIAQVIGVKLTGIRVCDGCYNLCSAFSVKVMEEKEEWEKQKAEAASRNMTDKPSNADQRLALLGKGGRVESMKETPPSSKLHELSDVMNKNKALLGERGQKLSRLDEKVSEMNQQAKSFADSAELIKKRAKNGWF